MITTKDANLTERKIKTTLDGDEHIPHNIVDRSAPLLPFVRFLDINGDGSGNTLANGDYSSSQGVFYIQPGAGEVLEIIRLVAFIQDSASWNLEHYGNLAAALTTGIRIKATVNSVVSFLDGGQPITQNGHWPRLTGRASGSDAGWGGGDDGAIASLELASPLELIGDNSDKLEFTFDDDLTGLIDHRFCVHGRVVA